MADSSTIITMKSSEAPKIEMPIDKDILKKYKFGNLHDNDSPKNKEASESA